MADDEKPRGWWYTVPGVLTAVGGVIGAVTALIIALDQAGFFNSAKEGPPVATAPKATQLPEPRPSAPTPSTAPPTPSEPIPAKPEVAPTFVDRESSSSLHCPTPRLRLRHKSAVISVQEVERMVRANGFFDVSINPNHEGFPNEYRLRDFRGDKVIIDYATCLMWKQSGSPNSMTWYDAPNYAVQLNDARFAGFSDWRIPTIEELASLMEQRKATNDYHLDPMFDLGSGRKGGCWSIDRKQYPTAADTAWPAGVSYGGVLHGGNAATPNCVIAVRSMQ